MIAHELSGQTVCGWMRQSADLLCRSMKAETDGVWFENSIAAHKTTLRPGPSFVEKDLATQLGGIAYNTGPVSLYSGGDNGFASLFQNTLPDNNPNAGDNGDQAHHFAAFLNLAINGVPELAASRPLHLKWRRV